MPKSKLLDILRNLEPLGPEDAFPDDIDAGLIAAKDNDDDGAARAPSSQPRTADPAA